MRCFNCSAVLTNNDYCENCGANIRVYRRIMRTADAYYNDGLAKAGVRDMGGAAESLRHSIRYNKYHTDARNLLGLIYYETGDVVRALTQWVTSNSLQPQDNAAAQYLAELQGNAAVLERAGQAIKKYNVAVGYVRAGSEDLAVIQLKRVVTMNPHMVSAYQLLALLQMKRGDYRKAKRNLMIAHRIDAGNTATIRYMRETDRLYAARGANPEHLTSTGSNRDRVSYKSGNDLVIQPATFQSSHRFQGVLTVLAAFALGLLAAYFLILPAQREQIREEYREKEQTLLSQIDKETLGLVTEEPTETAEAKASAEPDATASAGASEKPQASASPQASEAADEETVDTDVFGDASEMELDDSMTAEDYFDRGADKYDNGEYEEAVSNTQKALAIDDTHLMSLYYLGRAYQMLGEDEKAVTVYERIIELYPDNELADDAERFISELE